jgi:bacterioferritin
MKGSPKVIEQLQRAIDSERLAIHQYILHRVAADNAGFPQLAKAFFKRALQEMQHMDGFQDRMVFLGGSPDLNAKLDTKPSDDPAEELKLNLHTEMGAVKLYANAVQICEDEGDPVTRKLFSRTLRDEENHVNYLETEIRKISRMGDAYLAELAEK